jgi:hypothetical protein
VTGFFLFCLYYIYIYIYLSWGGVYFDFCALGVEGGPSLFLLEPPHWCLVGEVGLLFVLRCNGPKMATPEGRQGWLDRDNVDSSK